ncbi:hypothetical protein PIB30_029496 [Stylosanthes scabra]|uniref:PAP/OAS1 substrate-binding-related domain-containing protein n=1 Tax=Stylosanthes scabra TaxID=79078 RepID=A0ABU6SC46_9FABA|nr:hypothetical protein [Stylosanthes scabra]
MDNNVQEKPFRLKFINIIDPLRPNNNLGRSISRGSAIKIKSAMASGEEKLLGLVECAVDVVVLEFDLLFNKLWNRNDEAYRNYAPNIHNNNATTVTEQQGLQNSSEDANAAFLDSLWRRVSHRRAQFPAWPEPFNADSVLLYLLEQEINHLKNGNRNNNNDNSVTPFSFNMAMNMDRILIAHVLDGDFQSHWWNMKIARVCVDGTFYGLFYPFPGPSIIPPPPLQLQVLMLGPQQCPPMMQIFGPNSGNNQHHNVGTGTFIPDQGNYQSRNNFHGRRRNYERGREGRFNYEYGRTHGNAQMFQNSNYNHNHNYGYNNNQRNGNLVWRPMNTNPSMNMRNHNNGRFNNASTSSTAATAGSSSQRDFAYSASDWSSLPRTSR